MAIFTNQATMTYNGRTVNSNIATGNLLETLTMTKTPVSSSYAAGDNVTYVINLINSGTTALNGITVTDNLGSYQTAGGTTVYPLTYEANSLKYYINGVLQITPTVTAGPPLSITGLNIPAGSNAAIVYNAAANEFAPLTAESTIQNTVTATGAGLGTPITAESTVAASAQPELNIIKAISPATVTQNSQVTYTFTIQNTGNTAAVAADNIIITDTFNPVLSDIAVTFNSTAWTSPTNYTYNATSGLFTTAAGQITVPAATYTQDPTTGVITVVPGESVLTVTGTI